MHCHMLKFYFLGTIQKFVLKQNSFEENDEILLALAGIKQVGIFLLTLSCFTTAFLMPTYFSVCFIAQTICS